MNHPYVASADGTDRCSRCKYPFQAHTDKAVCDCCPSIGPVEIRYGNMLMCADCWTKEQHVSAEHMSPENQQKRVQEYRDKENAQQKIIMEARRIDNSIEVRTDLFNAATTSIVDLKKAIDENSEIKNKPYALAEELSNRFNHYKKVVFELNEQLVEAGNQQKAIQVYLNNLANQLRTEEREKLKIADINYRPTAIKSVKPKSISTTGIKPTKVDKTLRAKYAKELGISEFTLQQVIIASGGDIEKAMEKIQASIQAARTQVQ